MFDLDITFRYSLAPVIPSTPSLSPYVSLARHLCPFLPLLALSGVSATHNTHTLEAQTLTCTIHLFRMRLTPLVEKEDKCGWSEDLPTALYAVVELAKYCERELLEGNSRMRWRRLGC